MARSCGTMTRTDEPLSDEEFKELVAELIRHQDENLPEIDWDQAIRDSIAEHSKIQMFDYGTGEMSSMQAMADFYGWPIVTKSSRKKNTATITNWKTSRRGTSAKSSGSG